MVTDTHGDNDNNDPWQTLSLATRRLLQLDEKGDEARESEPAPSNGDKEKREAHAKYVEQRLQDLRAFERRSAGSK